jgi:hypothetical protein
MAPTSAQPFHSLLVQRVVAYNVEGALDGVTPARGTASIDEEDFNVVDIVGAAGIFDPSRIPSAQSSMGDRYIEWLEVIPSSLLIGGEAFVVVARELGDLMPAFGSRVILDLPSEQPEMGDQFYYTTEPIFVPQCADIRIGGFDSGARPNLIRMGIRTPTTSYEDALLRGAWCCGVQLATGGAGDGGGGGGGSGDQLSRQTQTFSTSTLSMSVGPSYYLQFSSGVTTEPLADNASESILQDNEGVVPISAEKFAIRAGTVSALVIRTSTPIIIDAFVELAVGAGAFVRTVAAAGVAVAANTNVVVPIEPVEFEADTRIRVGYTSAVNAVADVQAELELTTIG